jgi:hypothetical protein
MMSIFRHTHSLVPTSHFYIEETRTDTEGNIIGSSKMLAVLGYECRTCAHRSVEYIYPEKPLSESLQKMIDLWLKSHLNGTPGEGVIVTNDVTRIIVPKEDCIEVDDECVETGEEDDVTFERKLKLVVNNDI